MQIAVTPRTWQEDSSEMFLRFCSFMKITALLLKKQILPDILQQVV